MIVHRCPLNGTLVGEEDRDRSRTRTRRGSVLITITLNTLEPTFESMLRRSDQMVDEVEKASALELDRYAWSRDHKTPAGGISNQARVE